MLTFTLPLRLRVRISNSRCLQHRLSRSTCPVRPAPNRYRDTVIHGTNKNYEGRLQDLMWHQRPSRSFSPLLKMRSLNLDLRSGDCIDAFSDNKKLDIVFCGSKLIDLETILYLNRMTIEDPSAGPQKWHKELKKKHRNEIANVLKRSGRMYTEIQLDNVVQENVLNLEFWDMIYDELWVKIWKPQERKIDIFIWMMGGECIMLDHMFKLFKYCYSNFDRYINYKQINDESNVTDDDDYEKKEKFKFDLRYSGRIPCGLLLIHNYRHYCPYAIPTPKGHKCSEEHPHTISALTNSTANLLNHAEEKQDKVVYKSDGFKNIVNVGDKSMGNLRAIYGDPFCGYDIDDLNKRTFVASDGLHRTFKIKDLVKKGDKEARLAIEDRSALSCMADYPITPLQMFCGDNDWMDIMTFLDAFKYIYRVKSILNILTNHVRNQCLLRKTYDKENRKKIRKALGIDEMGNESLEYRTCCDILRITASTLHPAHLGFILTIIWGLRSFEQMRYTDVTKQWVQYRNRTIERITIPRVSVAPSIVIYIFQKRLNNEQFNFSYITTEMITRNGFHTLTMLKGWLLGYYSLSFLFRFFVD